MAETYSLAVLGMPADHNPYGPSNKTLTLADSVARDGSQQQAMRLGTVFLAKGPDGIQRLYTLDAARSTPSLPVLVAWGG